MWGPAFFLAILICVNPKNKYWIIVLIILASATRAASHSGWLINLIEIAPNYAGIVGSLTLTIGSISSFISPLVWGATVTDMVNKHLIRQNPGRFSIRKCVLNSVAK